MVHQIITDHSVARCAVRALHPCVSVPIDIHTVPISFVIVNETNSKLITNYSISESGLLSNPLIRSKYDSI